MVAPPVRSAEAPEAPPAHDVRAEGVGFDALVLFHRGRRLLSALVLVIVDLTGITLALYAALVIRNAYRGEDVLFGLPWAAVSTWLQFIALVLVLVFARAGLYRQREARPGADAVIRSLALVTLITAFYAVAVAGMTFHSYYGIFWITFVLAAILVPLLRASYNSVTLELMRLLGVHRRTVLVGPFGELSALERTLRRDGRGPDLRVIGTVSEHAGGDALPDSPSLGALADLEQIVAEHRPDDVVMTGFELSTAELVSLVDTCRAYGSRLRVVPTTTELLLERAVLVPGQAVVLFEVRPPVLTGVEWAIKRAFDIVVSAILIVSARDSGPDRRAGRAAHEPGPGDLPQSAHRRRRGRVRDAQVPLDVRGRRAPAGRARGAQRGRRRDLQDARRPAHHPGRPHPAPLLDRRAAPAVERPARRDEPGRPASAAAARLRAARALAPRALPSAAGHHGPLAGLRAARRSASTTWCASTSTTSRTGRSGSTSRSSRARRSPFCAGAGRTSLAPFAAGSDSLDRMPTGMKRVPRPLLVLTLAVLCHNIVWVVALPAWQGPDESSHYAYVERLAADHTLMRFDHEDVLPANSEAVNASLNATGLNFLRFRLSPRPFGAAGADRVHFPREASGLPQHNAGSLGANNYPPAYYVAALPFFELPWLSRATQRDYSIRLLSALLGALVVVLTYRLARTAGLASRLALLAAALATSVPIMTQQSAVFSPDILLVVAITGLADATLRARRRFDRRAVIPLLAWGALAALTKPVGFPAAAAVALTIAILTFGHLRAWARVGLLAGASVIGLVVGGVFASTLFGIAVPDSYSLLDRLRFDSEYLWQYYLPRLPHMNIVVPPATPASPPAAWMWGKEAIGIFGWLTTPLPLWAYRLAWIPTLVAGGVAIAGGIAGRAREGAGRNVALALAAAAVAYLLVLHYSEATYLLASGNRLLQGRYFLPAYPMVAVAVMAGMGRFGERVAVSVGLVVLAAWTLVGLEALNTVVVYFG